jgi:hypothetical protein
MRKSLATVLVTALAIAALTSAAQAEMDRSMQGDGAYAKFKADGDERLNFNNDYQHIVFPYDFNRDVPVGNLCCSAFQVVPKGQSQRLKKAAATGFLVTQGATFPLDEQKVKYAPFDPNDVVSGITLVVPQLNDYDFYSYKKHLSWDATADGTLFSDIYKNETSDDVLFNMGLFNKGKMKAGNWEISYCGVYSWDWTNQQIQDDLARGALEVLIPMVVGDGSRHPR